MKTLSLRNAALRHIPVKASGIYKITNHKDGKFYIGSAADVRRRMRHHLIMLRNGDHSSPHLQRAWDRDGEESFGFDMIEPTERQFLYEREQHWLDETRCYDDSIGYNICRKAGPPPILEYTPEMRDAISRRFKGKPKSEEHRKKIGDAHKGQSRSEEQREKIRQKIRALWQDPAYRDATTKNMKGRPAHNKGIALEAGHKAKFAAGRIAFWEKAENREAVASKLRGKPSPRKGATLTDETKEKIAEAARRRYADPDSYKWLIRNLDKANARCRSPEANAKRSAKVANRANEKNRKYTDADVAAWKAMKESGISYQKMSIKTGVDVATMHRRINAIYKEETP